MNAPLASPPQQPAPAQTLLDGITVTDLVVQIRRILRFLRKYWVLLIAGAAVLGALGGVAGFLMPRTQSAFFEVRLVPKVSDNPVAVFSRSNIEFFASAETNFRSVSLVQETLNELGISLERPEDIFAIRDRLQFYPIGHNTYRGTFMDADADDARSFLEHHSENYLKEEIRKTLGVIEGEMRFLKERLSETEAELVASESNLQEFRELHADGLPEQAEQHYNTLRALQQRKIETEAELDQVALELKLNREKLAGEKLFVESKVISTQRKTPFQDAIVGLKKDLADSLSAGMNKSHPKVTRLQDLIERYSILAQEQASLVETETEESRNPIYESIQDTIYQLEVREQVARKSYEQILGNLEGVTAIVANLPELQKRYAQLTRNYEVTSDLQHRIYNQYKVTELQLSLFSSPSPA